MAFCTECGSKLPDDAVFCPNCGASLTPSIKKDGGQTGEVLSEQRQTEEFTVPAVEEKQPEVAAVSGTFQTSGSYETPASSISAPVQGTYVPPVQNSYVPPYQGSYASQQQPQYGSSTAYGYSAQGGVGVATQPKKKLSAGAIVAIVLGSVIVLALAICLILYFIGSADPYSGYWESAAVDVGDGVISEDYYGTSVVGALSIQLNTDDSAYLASSTNTDVIEGTWQESDNGVIITTPDDTYSLNYEDEQLILTIDGESYYFNKLKDRDINNPTIPHGSQADASGNGSQAADNIAGSGDIGDGNYYITVTGAEDFTDVDGDPAIRIYYDYTNNNQKEFSTSAYDTISYYATQDGSDLTETYSYDDSAATNLSYYIRKGVTIQCCAEFKYNPNGGSVDLSFYGYNEGESGGFVLASYTPGNLPGAPAPYVIVPVNDPKWTLSLASEDTLDDFYVVVNDAELLTDANGNPAIRVYYEFTNNSNYNTSLGDELYVISYQDGISLDYSSASEGSETDTDTNLYTQIAPGQTISCSCVFTLRNQNSPVEAEVEANKEFVAVGQTYNVAD